MATKINKALVALNELIRQGVEYPAAHTDIVAKHGLNDKQASELTNAYDTQEAAFAKSTPPADTDPNAKYRVLSMEIGTKGTESHVRIRVYLLNPGETFERFGGSRQGLTVRKTASLIVSTLQCGSSRDTEYDLRGGVNQPDVWAWLKRCVLREAGVKVPDEE